MTRGAFLLLLSIVFQTGSMAFGKHAAVSMTEFTFVNVITNASYLLSLTCLGLQALTWQLTLARLPLGLAYGATSIVYVNTLALSAFVFGETITPGNVLGALLIVAGVTLLVVPRGSARAQ